MDHRSTRRPRLDSHRRDPQLFYWDDGKYRDAVSRMLAHIPLGRPGTIRGGAHARFLAVREASYVNGAVLTVDGGWTAGYARDF